MTIVYSEKLAEVLDSKIKQKLLPQCKKTAMWHYVATSSADYFARHGDVTKLLTAIQKKHGLPCDFTVAAAEKSTRRCWVFVFDQDESSAIELVTTSAVRGKVPHKVLVRMVADRLAKSESHFQAKDRPAFSRDLLNADVFKKVKKKYAQWNGSAPWWLQHIEFCIERDDMNAQVYDEAWDLHKVRGVMNT